jgi:hypothetical protein
MGPQSTKRVATTLEKPTSVALFPFVNMTFSYNSQMLSRYNIKSMGIPSRKITSLLQPMKDNMGLKTAGVYSIPCTCGQVFIGQIGPSRQIGHN